MKKANVIEFKCKAVCPDCAEVITVDADEFESGGCYCLECGTDFELQFNSQELLESNIRNGYV